MRQAPKRSDRGKNVISLRASKKDRTRRVLLEVADALFAENGYEATTLEQICQAASISMRTFFRYFESKPDLALYENLRNVGRLREVLEESGPGRLLDRLEALYEAMASELVTDPHARRRVRLMLREPALVARSLMIDLDNETRIAGAFAREWRSPVGLQARLLAAYIVGGARAALIDATPGPGQASLVGRISEAFRFIRESHVSQPPVSPGQSASPPRFAKKTK